MARIGQMEASRPDLESPCLALSIDAVFSKTLPLDSSIHYDCFWKKGQNVPKKSVQNARENDTKIKGNAKKSIETLSKGKK